MLDKESKIFVAGHSAGEAEGKSEGRHYAALGVHVDVGLDLVGLHLGLEYCLEGFEGDMGVPEPVVRVERKVALVDLMVEGAVIATVLADIHHPLIAAIE